MTLTELLKIQNELNQHCPRYPEGDELTWAIAAELGEFAQARKGDWCWWKRDGKGFESLDRAIQADEIADLVCFALTDCLSPCKTIPPAGMMLDWWGIGWAFKQSSISSIFCTIVAGSACEKIASIAMLAKACGFEQAEIESAYLAKVEINKKRWEAVS